MGSLEDAIAKVARQSLPLVAGVMLVGCALYSFVNLVVISGSPLGVAVTILTGLVCGVLAWRFYREEAPLSRAHVYGGCLALLALANISLHFVLRPVPWQTTSFLVFVLAVGGLVLSRLWLLALLAASWISWGAVVYAAPSNPGWPEAALLLSLATLFAVSISAFRYNAIRENWIQSSHLERMNRRLSLTQMSVDSSPEAILWFGFDDSLAYVNDAACRLLGYSRLELLSLSGADLRPLRFSTDVERDFVQRLAQGETLTFEADLSRADRSTFPAEIMLNPIGEEVGGLICCTARDLSERRAMERDVSRAQRMDSLQVLAGGLAHDFNNLLTAVTGNAEALVQSLPQRSDTRDAAEEILAATERATLLTRQLLAFAGRGTTGLEPLDLSREVAAVSQLLESMLPKGVSLCVSTAAGLPAVRGDAAEIQQIAMNLVTNAGEALARAGRVQVRTGRVELGEAEASALEPAMQRPAGEYVFVEVEDPGSGITAADQTKIFDPFFTSKTQGRGLGLAAVAGIVRRHRGGVHVVSERGVGTCISVLFPSCEESPVVPAGEERIALAKRGRALVADDEPTVRRVARLALEQIGFTVEEAVDGASAVARVRESAQPIDVVLLDMTMPGLSGADTFRLLRALEPELPIVLNSGFDAETMSATVAGDPKAVFLAKPYRRGQLVAALDRVMPADSEST